MTVRHLPDKVLTETVIIVPMPRGQQQGSRKAIDWDAEGTTYAASVQPEHGERGMESAGTELGVRMGHIWMADDPGRIHPGQPIKVVTGLDDETGEPDPTVYEKWIAVASATPISGGYVGWEIRCEITD